MQTIKTAAIVVLMMTVLYGGYVSLTTPPEPLPEEIEGILVIEESVEDAFGTEHHLAGNLELGPVASEQTAADEPGYPSTESLTTIPSGYDSPQTAAAALDGPSFELPESGSVDTPSTAEFANKSDVAQDSRTGSFGGSFADLPVKKTGTSATTSIDLPTARKLPEVNGSATTVTPRDADSYASTPNRFQLPDPDQASQSFDPSRGKPFEGNDDGPVTHQLADAANQTPSSNAGLINAFNAADEMYARGQMKEALATLSVFYGTPNLTEKEQRQLLSRLDPLAREVIYSRRHLLEKPHKVGASETLVEIASRFNVPWQLLANINGVEDPVTVLPGTELKTLRGPFRAEVDLTGKKLTMFLGDLYAGRFDIAVGSDPPPATGTFTVQEKQTEHVYYDRSGIPVPAGSPDNPYGNMWLDLGGQICIHGSPNTVQPTSKGCISVAGDYADDVYGILSQGSSITIRR